MNLDDLNKEIRYLKGIGPKRAEAFNKLGIFKVSDLLEYFPRTYEDRTIIRKINELTDGESCVIKAIVDTMEFRRIRRNLNIIKATVKDESGYMSVVWFNQDYLRSSIKPGNVFWFFGKVKKGIIPELINPVFNEDLANIEGIVPVYRKNASLSQNFLRKSIRTAIEISGNLMEEFMPETITAAYRLMGYNDAVRNIHFPKSPEKFLEARRRLVFQEFFILQVSLLILKLKIGKNAPPKEKLSDFSAGNQYMDNLDFNLTNAQKRVISEIRQDLSSGKPMNRLIQGDVGSGKTAVAATIITDICSNEMQAAFMAPTEILALQHYENLGVSLAEYGIRTELLTGSIKGAERDKILADVSEGRINLLIGTHALIQDNVQFNRLGLVITDEQHRFGVEQRAVLGEKGNAPHSMVLTATPIPRTLALILYGDLDISVIDEMPPGRKPVETHAVAESKRLRVLEFVEKRIKNGGQVYYVCPRIEDSDGEDGILSVEKVFDELRRRYPDYIVRMMHGKMKNSEKEKIMREFRSGIVSLLVSTTVIEVGVNVPNATLMVIDNAERFGLAQLHQLRGRVGRGEEQAYCIMINRGGNPISEKRMKIMEKTNDGFVISEEDLRIRGPGEFFGTRQHGLPEFRIANIYTDMDVLKQAQKAAVDWVSDDLDLQGRGNHNIMKKINEEYGKLGNLQEIL